MPKQRDVLPEQIGTAELAALAAEPLSTIDHWAGLALLDHTYFGRRRVFDRDTALARCRRIRELQASGVSLQLIRREFEDG